MAAPTDDRHLTWRETSRELILRCPVFDLFRSQRRPAADGAGEAVPFYVLEARDWVSVVPILRSASGEEAFVMVRQFRHGIDRVTLEFPAGLVEPEEPPERAATRELCEETGYEGGVLTHLGTIGAAPAFMNNWCHVYVATGLERRHEQALDETERVDVVRLPVGEVMAGMGSGELINSVTAMSLYYFMRWKEQEGADRTRTGA